MAVAAKELVENSIDAGATIVGMQKNCQVQDADVFGSSLISRFFEIVFLHGRCPAERLRGVGDRGGRQRRRNRAGKL